MSTPKAITLISVNATQTFNLLVPGATTDSCSLFRNCVTSSCLSPNTISTPSLQIPPPRLTPFHFPFADSRSDQLLFHQIAIQRKKKRMNRRALFSTTILDRTRRGRLSHPPRLQIDDITIPSCLVAPRGGIVFPFRKEFPLPKRLRFRESTRHISLSLSLFCLESRYSSRKKLKVQKWVWHRAMLRRHWYRWTFYRLSLQVKRPPDSKTFSIIDSVDFGRRERFIRCYSVEVGGRCCLERVDSQFS